MRRMLSAGLSALLLSIAAPAIADTPAGGIGGVAVNPANDTVLVAGDTRTIYVLDRATLEVTNRVYVGTTIVWMTYNADGSLVFTRDTDGTLEARDAASLQRKWTVDRTEGVDYAPISNQLVYIKRDSKNGVLTLLNAADFTEINKIDLGEMSPNHVAMSPEGLRAVVISRSEKRESEEKDRASSDLKGIVRSKFNQEHDQRGAKIVTVDLLLGNAEAVESWYKSDNIKDMRVSPTEAFVLSYTNEMARIAADGSAEIIDSGARNHYGAGMTPGMDAIVSGSLKSITLKPLDSDAAQVFKLDDLPGWPEYVIRFTNTPDGKILAGTTAYRIIELDPAAGAVKAMPVN